jgi:predicted RNase H-like HicB family nuclease
MHQPIHQPHPPQSQTMAKHEITVTLMLAPQPSGGFVASVMEFPACRVESATREGAVAQLQTALSEHVAHVEVMPWVVGVDPLTFGRSDTLTAAPTEPTWMKFAGIFKDDADFAEIMDELRAERESDDDSEIDPAYYLSA